MAERSFINRRRAPRAAVSLEASVVTISDYQYYEIVDLSATGAKMRGPPPPPLGKTALFRLDRFQALCRTVWAEGELCGVRFDELVPPGTLAQLRDSGSRAQVGVVAADELGELGI
jgi:hypothetical protein